MKKTNNYIKNNFKGIITGTVIGILLCSIVGVYAVTYFPSNQTTYDNKESGLNSSNVQSAIDELYNECSKPATIGENILEQTDIVSSGDGLYKDEYEDRYFYKGKNPNNYITFNNEIWRIISIEYDGTIKIIKEDSIGEIAWDEANTQNWSTPASLNTYLNNTYLNTLKASAQKQIAVGNFSLGAVTRGNQDLADQINEENSIRWYGKIALPTVSEYIRANSNSASCNSWHNLSSCANTNWMYNANIMSWWTLIETKEKTSSYGSVYIILGQSNVDGNGTINSGRVTRSHSVRPTLYLSSNVQIIGGNGSVSNPYKLSQ